MKFGIFSIILLLGTLQGVILSLMLLFSGGGRRQSKYFLAAFMLVLAYNSFGTFCWSVGLDVGWLGVFDDIFPYTFIFTLGPSFYFYIESSTVGDYIPTKRIVRLYLPALVDCSFRICLLIYAILYNNKMAFSIKPGEIDSIYQPIAMLLMVIVFWAYLLSAIIQFGKRYKQIATISAEQKLVVKWTKVLLIVMTVVALIWAITIFDSLLFHIRGINFFKPIEITLVIFVYWIGLRGYQLTRVVYITSKRPAKLLPKASRMQRLKTACHC